MFLLLSIAPFLLFLYLLLGKKLSLLKVSAYSLALTTFEVIAYWQIQPFYFLTSYAKGFFIALDIFLIIVGAVFFLEIMEKSGTIRNLCLRLEGFSKDYRAQVLILAWFAENFLEGTAGFGTPVAIVAPLLVALGLAPLRAVIISLLGNSTSVVFGAAGTPIRVGFASLPIAGVPQFAASLNFVGILVPVFMLAVLVRGRGEAKKHFFECLPFALWCGLAFVLPSWLLAFFGPEFPSIIGSLIGLGLVLLTTKAGLFVPPTRRITPIPNASPASQSLLTLSAPYLLLVLCLIVGKFTLGNVSLLIPGINHQFNLFNPGWAFVLAGLVSALIFRQERKLLSSSLKIGVHRSWEPFFVIICTSSLVQLMLNSGHNLSGWVSSLSYLAGGIHSSVLAFLTPFIGAFGSFLTGSATISNLMFGSLLVDSALLGGLSVAKILALQVTGAAAGNMIALADMLAGESIVGLKNQERHILKGVITPCLISLFLLALLGLLLT